MSKRLLTACRTRVRPSLPGWAIAFLQVGGLALLALGGTGCLDVCTDAEALCNADPESPPFQVDECEGTTECRAICITELDSCSSSESIECQEGC